MTDERDGERDTLTQRDPSGAPPAAAERFGKYELLAKIGEGGMAEVFKARVTGIEGFEKILVVKKILPVFAKNKAFVAMLVAEAKLCSALQHPNIVPIYELGVIGDTHYIAMEYVEGVDLLQILQRAARRNVKIPIPIALHLTSEVAKALDYAHGVVDRRGRPLRIIHRDVSPANVMVGFSGQVKLMDFGVARADLEASSQRGAAQVVRHDGLKGKLSYMSPELVSGMEIDHRSDLFALGTLLYEMLTLKRLFTGRNQLQTMANVRNARITRRMKRHEYIPEGVQAIIRTALARDRDERYQVAHEVEEDIQDYIFEQRYRVGPKRLARFVAELFPERRPRRAKLQVKRRHKRARALREAGVRGRGDLAPGWVAGLGAAGGSSPEVAVPPLGGMALEGRDGDPLDELLLALSEEARAEAVEALADAEGGPGGDDAPSDASESASAPPLRGAAEDEEVFGPITFTSSRNLLRSRAAGADEEVRVDGAPWVRIRHADIKHLDPSLFAPPGEAVYGGPIGPGWLPRLFYQLFAARVSGMLALTRGWLKKDLFYVDGELLHIASNIKGELLAPSMLADGMLCEAQVAAGLAWANAHGTRLGRALVATGAVSEDELDAVLQRQQRRRFCEIFSWRQGRFAFYDEVGPPAHARPHGLGVLELLGPALREHYDLATLRAIFAPHMRCRVARRDHDLARPESLGLSSEERAALELLEHGARVAGLPRAVGGPAEEASMWRALFALVQCDLASLVV